MDWPGSVACLPVWVCVLYQDETAAVGFAKNTAALECPHHIVLGKTEMPGDIIRHVNAHHLLGQPPVLSGSYFFPFSSLVFRCNH